MVKTFHHQFVAAPDVKQITNPDTGKRCYITPAGISYPSVTTVLAELPNKGLTAWKKRKGETKAKAISDSAKRRGTNVHHVAELYLRNESLEFVDPIQKGLFNQIKPTLNNIDNIRLIEKPLYSNRLRMAGTPDCIAEYGGLLSVIDFKTATRSKDEKYITGYFSQCGAYTIMFDELFGVKPEQAVVIIAVEDSNIPQVFKKDSSECFLMLKDYVKQLNEYREQSNA